jgi:hypothetical protein
VKILELWYPADCPHTAVTLCQPSSDPCLFCSNQFCTLVPSIKLNLIREHTFHLSKTSPVGTITLATASSPKYFELALQHVDKNLLRFDLFEVYFFNANPPVKVWHITFNYISQGGIGAVEVNFHPVLVDPDIKVAFRVACLASQRLVSFLQTAGLLLTRLTVARGTLDTCQEDFKADLFKSLALCGVDKDSKCSVKKICTDKEEYRIGTDVARMTFGQPKINSRELSQIFSGAGIEGCTTLGAFIRKKESSSSASQLQSTDKDYVASTIKHTLFEKEIKDASQSWFYLDIRPGPSHGTRGGKTIYWHSQRSLYVFERQKQVKGGKAVSTIGRDCGVVRIADLAQKLEGVSFENRANSRPICFTIEYWDIPRPDDRSKAIDVVERYCAFIQNELNKKFATYPIPNAAIDHTLYATQDIHSNSGDLKTVKDVLKARNILPAGDNPVKRIDSL